MKILWFTWKDIKHPQAGGAEIVSNSMLSRLAKEGHEVTMLTARYEGSEPEGMLNDYKVIRVGGKFTVYWHVYRYYMKHFWGKHDLVIEEVNTIPFFTKYYTQSRKSRSFLFFHQLAREVWFYQMFFPLSVVGYLIEPIYLRFINDMKVITISLSTKTDLVRYGFKRDNIALMRLGIEIEPLRELAPKSLEAPTVLSLGAVRHMKRTLDIVRAFEVLKHGGKEVSDGMQLIIAGDMKGKYGRIVTNAINRSGYKESIQLLGRVSKDEKMRLMRESTLLAVTSLKEGWGLVVPEANSQGTPAVVYNVDGLRDSVQDGVTGLIAKTNTPQGLAASITELLSDKEGYDRVRKAGYEWSKTTTFDRQYEDFKKAIQI